MIQNILTFQSLVNYISVLKPASKDKKILLSIGRFGETKLLTNRTYMFSTQQHALIFLQAQKKSQHVQEGAKSNKFYTQNDYTIPLSILT